MKINLESYRFLYTVKMINATSEEVVSTYCVTAWHHINLIPASQLRALQGSKRWGESISKVSSFSESKNGRAKK